MGDAVSGSIETLSRLLARVEFDTNGGCWLWSGATSSGGYGSIRPLPCEPAAPAHRLSYVVHKGSIPDGLHVCHACDVRACINPDHLWLGTRSDNMRDMLAKGRRTPPTVSGSYSPNLKFTSADIRQMHLAKRSGATAIAIAERWNTTAAYIRFVLRGAAWPHVAQEFSAEETLQLRIGMEPDL